MHWDIASPYSSVLKRLKKGARPIEVWWSLWTNTPKYLTSQPPSIILLTNWLPKQPQLKQTRLCVFKQLLLPIRVLWLLTLSTGLLFSNSQFLLVSGLSWIQPNTAQFGKGEIEPRSHVCWNLSSPQPRIPSLPPPPTSIHLPWPNAASASCFQSRWTIPTQAVVCIWTSETQTPNCKPQTAEHILQLLPPFQTQFSKIRAKARAKVKEINRHTLRMASNNNRTRLASPPPATSWATHIPLHTLSNHHHNNLAISKHLNPHRLLTSSNEEPLQRQMLPMV